MATRLPARATSLWPQKKQSDGKTHLLDSCCRLRTRKTPLPGARLNIKVSFDTRCWPWCVQAVQPRAPSSLSANRRSTMEARGSSAAAAAEELCCAPAAWSGSCCLCDQKPWKSPPRCRSCCASPCAFLWRLIGSLWTLILPTAMMLWITKIRAKQVGRVYLPCATTDDQDPRLVLI